MKIRQGFVSNSSTSSFLIYGAQVKAHDFIDDTKWEEMRGYKIPEGLNFHNVEGAYFLGRSWDAVKDNQTGAEFKREVEDLISKFVGQAIKCSTIEQAWYNG